MIVLVPASYVLVPLSTAPAARNSLTTNVEAVTVEKSTGSLNVTLTCAVEAAPDERSVGVTDVIVGGVTSGGAMVVNVELNGVAPFPARSWRLLVMLTV